MRMKTMVLVWIAFRLVMMLFGPNGLHPDPDVTYALIGYGYEHPNWYEFP